VGFDVRQLVVAVAENQGPSSLIALKLAVQAASL
jgi:hypothetical protein